MVHYKLYYFNGRGAAETIRQIFKLAEKEFEDFRIERSEWENYKKDMPFGQVPVLEVDGKQLCQSYAIARYVAKEFGLAGKTNFEQALVDSYADQVKDFMQEARTYFRISIGFLEGDLEKEGKEVFFPAIEKNFALFSKALKENKSGFLVGDSATWVDLLLAEVASFCLKSYPVAAEKFPEIKAFIEKVHSIPQIKAWRETRPETPF